MLCGCAELRTATRGRRVGVHPLVLGGGDGAPIGVCEKCLEMVLDRRDAAADKGFLHGQDGYEELCALCGISEHLGSSRYTGTLAMCSAARCPRSYCTPCLGRLLSKAGLAEMESWEEWLCPPCACASVPLLAKARAKLEGGGGAEGRAEGGHCGGIGGAHTGDVAFAAGVLLSCSPSLASLCACRLVRQPDQQAQPQGARLQEEGGRAGRCGG